MSTAVYTFQMDDGRILNVEDDDHVVDVEEILEAHLGKRCAVATNIEPQPPYSNSVMTGFLIKA